MTDGSLQRPDLAALIARRSAQQQQPRPDGPLRGGMEAELAEARRHVLRVEWERIIPPKFVDARVTDFEEKVQSELRRWQDAQTDGVCLVLTGPVGTGKSHAAVAAVREPFGKDSSLVFVHAARLPELLTYTNPDHGANRRRLETVDIAVLDDLGTQSEHDWVVGELTAIVNERWLADRPTVVTSNLTPQMLAEALGERTYSRLADAGIGVRLAGDDRRRRS